MNPFFQQWAARVVAPFLVSFLKLYVWLSYLVLNALSVRPMYSERSAVSRVALYTTDSERHLLSTGQLALFLQLHLSLLSSSRSSLRSFMLCFVITLHVVGTAI